MVWSFGVAVASSAVALGFIVWLQHYPRSALLLLLCGAVVISSRLGGVAAGIASTLGTAFVAQQFVLSAGALPAGLGEQRVSLEVYLLLSLVLVATAAQWQKHRAGRRDQAAANESEERFRALFERSPEGIFLLDPCDPERLLPVLDCNEVACRQHGYARGEIIGQPLSLLNRQVSSRADLDALVDRLRREPQLQVETSHQHKNGRLFCVESRLSLIHFDQREVILGMVRDISADKEAEAPARQLNAELEERVRERTRQLEQANRELEAFSYSISHDLRAPVRAISGFAQIIREDYGPQLPGEAARLFRVICGTAGRMGELIDDLLAFARLNGREFCHLPVNMTALVQSVVGEFRHDRARDRATFQLQELPATSGDPSMLRQVFTNLIANALKFSRHAAQPHVEIGAWHEARREVYFVRDNGVGFDMKYACKLFKVFQRLHDQEKFEGTGVGLAIVQRVVQRHGGEVWAESQPGAGATFFFSLPTETEFAEAPFRPDSVKGQVHTLERSA